MTAAQTYDLEGLKTLLLVPLLESVLSTALVGYLFPGEASEHRDLARLAYTVLQSHGCDISVNGAEDSTE